MTPRACCPGQTHVPPRADLRAARERALVSGPKADLARRYEPAMRAFDEREGQQTFDPALIGGLV